MDEETLKQNLTALEEMLLDEEKLVTYLSLSKDLCIHVNSSKVLLNAFLEKIKGTEKESKFNIAYILSGITNENQGRTIVCPKTNLSEMEQQMKLVLFRHIYSICRNNVEVNDVAYTLVSRFEDLLLSTGLVRSEVCTKRSTEEIGNLKTSSQDPSKVQIPSASTTKIVKLETKKSSSKIPFENGLKLDKIKNEVLSPKSNLISPKKPNSPKKATSPKKPISPHNKSKPSTKQNVKLQKGIAGFFSKQNGVSKKTDSENTEKIIVKEEITSKPVEQMEVDEEVIKKPVKIEKETTVKTESKNVKKVESKSSTKKLSQIKKTAKVDKKRKRVLHVSDSESDEEKVDPFSDNEPSEPVNMSDDEIPPTPNISTIKVTSGIINPKKRRKIVDKTYTDEDGYILTKKEEVYESCSENEDEVAIKENVANSNPVKEKVPNSNPIKMDITTKDNKVTSKASKKKISPPQKGKQTSLTNFFQKK